ncbi:MAG: hypothetical protein IJE97_02050 [Thermoguttaceae bacterium]|nr:hypothetical protein [Thermoguttaceae bacterium]MBQ7111366.1 hypothetical protein [Thermoguttaceae bacterium]
MGSGSFVLLANGAHHAIPHAIAFLLAILSGAAAERLERALRKNSRFWFPTAFGAAIGLATAILFVLFGWRSGGNLFLAGGIGGFLGAAVVKARKQRKNVDQSGDGATEKSISEPGKKTKKATDIAIYIVSLLSLLAAGVCVVKLDRCAEEVSHRLSQKKKFSQNLEAFRNAFERGAYDEAFSFACACEEAGRDWPDNEMFLSDAHFMKAEAAEMAGDYNVASASYAAYKAERPDQNRGCVVTSEPRLAYKQGKTNEAFRGYCELFASEKEGSPSRKLNRLRFSKTATSVIPLLDYAEKDRVLSPFATYSDFLTFMETEFKAQDEPAEYAETMEFFRFCAKEANGDGDEKGGESEPSDDASR